MKLASFPHVAVLTLVVMILLGGRGGGLASDESASGWSRVKFETLDHAALLTRQSQLEESMARRPVSIVLATLEPDLIGVVQTLSAVYDQMERPAEAVVTVSEGGIMDDDLLKRRHVVTLARNSNSAWRIIGYRRGDLRRGHLKGTIE